mmetsp:Transcript_11860/g.25468  ORF Transcript_11860/g.25468 Transcript_11860/m.25468 type:complete len:216 (+) Transcript_11860:2817-3464(+)
MAVELDGVGDNQPLNLPGVAKGEPVVGLLVLEAVNNALAEHAVGVTDAIAPCWQVERGHRVQEACCQAAQTTIAQSCIALLLRDVLQVVSQLPQSLCVRLRHVQVVQSVHEAAAHEELHAQVVHTLGVLLLEVGLCVVPALNQAIPQAQSSCLVGLKIIKLVATTGHGVLNMVDDILLDADDVILHVCVHQRLHTTCVTLFALKLGACYSTGAGL